MAVLSLLGQGLMGLWETLCRRTSACQTGSDCLAAGAVGHHGTMHRVRELLLARETGAPSN